MKVAILGAGFAGLAAGLTLEKNGIIPDIYEQNSSVADQYSHVGVILDMAYRSITNQPLKYLNNLLSIELTPLEIIKKLIIHSKNQQVTIANETIGYSFIVGHEATSIQSQILHKLKNAQILYEQRRSVEELKEKYDHVIVATGSRSEDYVSDKYLKDWKQYLVAHTRVAKLYGDFEANTAIVWGNKELLKDGYAFLAPFSPKVASLYITVPHLKNWAEFDECWKTFMKQEQLLNKNTLLGVSQRTHVSANSSNVTSDNCLFVGDQGCFLDPFLGLGAVTSIGSGVMAAKAIIENKDYNKLVQDYKKVISVMGKIRNFYDNIDDATLDSLVTYEGNPILQKIIYGTDIDWLKYASFTVSPFVSKEKSRDFHETYTSPTSPSS